jgi:hypothetical protein
MVESVSLSIGGMRLANHVTCRRCDTMFKGPSDYLPAEMMKIQRLLNRANYQNDKHEPDLTLCKACDDRV